MTATDGGAGADAIELSKIGKTYGTFVAVRDLSLRVGRGEVFGLLGPNGAGKTTTIKMLMGVLRPTTGSASVFGLDCFERRPDVMRRVGYLPDDPVFYDHLRGGEILTFIAEMHGVSPSRAAERTRPLLSRFDLEDAVEEFAVNYSKGMKKKLALIAALQHDPDVLIFDEPTNGLDPYATRELLRLVREEAQVGKTILFSTHLLDQAERVCDRAGVVHRGELVADGNLADLRLRFGGREDASLEDVFFAATGEAPSSSDCDAESPPPERSVAP